MRRDKSNDGLKDCMGMKNVDYFRLWDLSLFIVIVHDFIPRFIRLILSDGRSRHDIWATFGYSIMVACSSQTM